MVGCNLLYVKCLWTHNYSWGVNIPLWLLSFFLPHSFNLLGQKLWLFFFNTNSSQILWKFQVCHLLTEYNGWVFLTVNGKYDVITGALIYWGQLRQHYVHPIKYLNSFVVLKGPHSSCQIKRFDWSPWLILVHITLR